MQKILNTSSENEALVRGRGLFYSFPLISVSNSKVLVVFFPIGLPWQTAAMQKIG